MAFSSALEHKQSKKRFLQKVVTVNKLEWSADAVYMSREDSSAHAVMDLTQIRSPSDSESKD